MVEEGVVSERVAQRWFQRFNTGEQILKIYHVLKDINYGILRIYAKFGRISVKKSTRRLSEDLGTSKDTIGTSLD